MDKHSKLIDKFGREVNYVRISVTDRCDFRCVYCMAEDMTFVPRQDVLSLEELQTVARAFTELGVGKIRFTGGEPLIRKNVISLFEAVGKLPGLKELVLTSNGSQLQKFAQPLRSAGVRRINISLDSLRADRFKALTRTGNLNTVLAGIAAAKEAGFERIKLNTVILKGRNEDEIIDLVEFARENILDISFIEEMPLGLIDDHDRELSFCSSDEIQALIQKQYPLLATTEDTGGPSRYFQMPDSEARIGFISPHSHNFCHLCNRVRVTAEGRLLLCLGNEHSVDLRAVLRRDASTLEQLKDTIVAAMDVKPERHFFDLSGEPEVLRFMNTTGG
jgi:cyclic pyranopterin phosphate synthase